MSDRAEVMSKLDKRSLIACKRCRPKKLKCDDSTPKTCQNCEKAALPCILVDPVSKREFDREYAESLGDRARNLRAALGESADSSMASSNHAMQVSGPSTYHAGNKWDLTHMAMRVCIENEYHLKAKGRFGLMEEQMRRRLFWASYISDRHIASLTGRPVAIVDRNINIEDLPIDADDDLIDAGTTGEQQTRGYSEVSFQLRQISLRKITSRIRTQLYRAPSSSLATEILAALEG
ncbi:hypothetical protein BJX65DRAFT_301229 [Aspergillus insuetus]